MHSFERIIVSLALVLSLGMVAGCAEQEEKAKERGKAIIDTVKEAGKSLNGAAAKMQERANQLDEINK